MTWRPLEQDWPEEATVKIRHDIFTDPNPKDWLAPHAEARAAILTAASVHIDRALSELEEAINWFSIVDPKDQGEVLRRVEALRDTIEYRASL